MMLDLSLVVGVLRGKGPKVSGQFLGKKTRAQPLESKGVSGNFGGEWISDLEEL